MNTKNLFGIGLRAENELTRTKTAFEGNKIADELDKKGFDIVFTGLNSILAILSRFAKYTKVERYEKGNR